MVRALSLIQMGMYMRVNGKMTCNTVKELLPIKLVELIVENGGMEL